MKRNLLFILFFVFSFTLIAQEVPELMEMKPEMTELWEPEVPVVTPGAKYGNAPSDAIILFDGTNLAEEWEGDRDSIPHWVVEDSIVTATRGGGIRTKRQFGDCQLHIEWRSPAEVKGTSQGRGNSGVFFHEKYEVQVLDNYENRTYRNGQAGSLYKQYAPLVNVCKEPGEWQTYDIIFNAPIFKDENTFLVPPRVTVLHNGVLVQNAVELRGPTEYIGVPEYTVKKHGKGSIYLQDHGNPVSYRNIWIREL
ncbi:MAG: DUF1080 domain-containing protein [Mariniphaga sp.]|nr:DUF1080 domain-containing protein [Mariniphaga sp.]